MRVTVMTVVCSTLGTVPKCLEKRLEDWKSENLTPSRLQHFRDQPGYLEDTGDVKRIALHTDSSENQPDNAVVKKNKQNRVDDDTNK